MTYAVVAFYKAVGELFDHAVRIWEGGRYSHCEIVLPSGRWISASPRDGGVRYVDNEMDLSKWDFVAIKVDDKPLAKATQWAATQEGKKYDWTGIFLSQILPFCIENPRKFFCSEFCIHFFQRMNMLSEVIPQLHGPNGFYDELINQAVNYDVELILSRDKPYEYTEKVVRYPRPGVCY